MAGKSHLGNILLSRSHKSYSFLDAICHVQEKAFIRLNCPVNKIIEN